MNIYKQYLLPNGSEWAPRTAGIYAVPASTGVERRSGPARATYPPTALPAADDPPPATGLPATATATTQPLQKATGTPGAHIKLQQRSFSMQQVPAGRFIADLLAGSAAGDPAHLTDADGKRLWHYRRHGRFN